MSPDSCGTYCTLEAWHTASFNFELVPTPEIFIVCVRNPLTLTPPLFLSSDRCGQYPIRPDPSLRRSRQYGQTHAINSSHLFYFVPLRAAPRVAPGTPRTFNVPVPSGHVDVTPKPLSQASLCAGTKKVQGHSYAAPRRTCAVHDLQAMSSRGPFLSPPPVVHRLPDICQRTSTLWYRR